MIKYQDLVGPIRERAALESTEQARETAEAVLRTLAHCLTPSGRHELADDLPGILDDAVLVPGQTELRDGGDLIIEIAQRLGTTPERARYLAKAVSGAIGDTEPDVLERLRRQLGSNLLDADADGDPPGRAASVRADVPTELSDDDVRQALRRLPEWTGDRSGISRTVSLPADRITPLVERVQREARQLNDHAHTERTSYGVTFTLRTGRPGVVTEPDLDLAERIDGAVRDIGSGGRPG